MSVIDEISELVDSFNNLNMNNALIIITALTIIMH
jgi:hypothetical protein